MSISNRVVAFLALLYTIAILPGCTPYGRPKGAYQARYESLLAGVQVPSDQAIRAFETRGSDAIPYPVAKVWEAYLKLVQQSWGLLGIGKDSNGGHRALMVAGERIYHSRQGRYLFVDRWLAVSIQPIDELSTRISIAFVEPEAARPASIGEDRISRQFVLVDKKAVSLISSDDLLQAIKDSLEGDRYSQRLPNNPTTWRGKPQGPEVERNTKRSLLLERHGNLTSVENRSDKYLLHEPGLERRIGEVVHRLAVAAGQPLREPKAFIVISPALEANIEPNGDLFLTTQTLAEAKNLDQLAGVIAHEMAHLYLDHGLVRAHSLWRARAVGGLIAGGAVIAGAIAGGLIQTSKPKSGSPADATYTNEEVIATTVAGLSAMYLGDFLGRGAGADVANKLSHRFSRRDELAADAYGAELLWAAGYDYRGLLKFLECSSHRLDGQPPAQRPKECQ